MDFNVKKLVGDAGTLLTRAVQYTEEKLGTVSEKTELDAYFESLAQKCDDTKKWTEKLAGGTEAVLTPHPGNRLEDYVLEKIEKRRPNRLSNLEYLGIDMVETGNCFGPGTAYGTALIKVGQTEQKLGQAEREMIGSAVHDYLYPMRKYLDTEMKTMLRERRLLENKRLDLDACKNKLRKARSLQGQQSAERELRTAQAEFDKQAEITKLLLEGIGSSHQNHLKHLQAYVEVQARYYEQCTQYLQDLRQDLAEYASTETSQEASAGKGRRARVLYEYDALDKTELSLQGDEVVIVHDSLGVNSDYLIAERGTQTGKVPRAFLELLD